LFCGTAQQCCPRRAGLPAQCGSSLQRNDAGVWLCEYPGLSFQRCPVRACSLASSLLLNGATMSQKSSLTQSAHSVRQVLTACTMSQESSLTQSAHSVRQVLTAYTRVAPPRFGRTLQALESRCPDYIPADHWQQAVEDGRRFLAQWGEQAEALGWTPSDLFGLAPAPNNARPSYRRLSRYDETGLIWLLRGRQVLALTEGT